MKTTFSPARSRAGSRPGGGKGLLASGAEVRLVLAAHRPGECPKNALPALAVLGRSNVGKSSLLNALLGVKVARVSQTPGRTQALYWYRVGDRFDVVDCPGYGFAKTGKEKRESFEGLIETLLLGHPRMPARRRPVRGAAAPPRSPPRRRPPRPAGERPFHVPLSKRIFSSHCRRGDEVGRREALAARAAAARSRGRFAAPDRPLLPVSAETGENLPELARLLRAALAPAPKE